MQELLPRELCMLTAGLYMVRGHTAAFSFPLQDIQEQYLQYLFDAGRAASTLKVYLTATSFNDGHIGGRPVGVHYWVTQCLHGARRLRPLG